MKQLLPVIPAEIPGGQNVDYIYEPDAQAVLGGLLPRFVEMEIYHAILESIASEQSARMVAMRSATDSANELIGELTLLYNKARQEASPRNCGYHRQASCRWNVKRINGEKITECH